MSLSEDEIFFISMEALSHVYLQAFAKMQSPCKQIELEAEALDSLWIILEGERTRAYQRLSWPYTNKEKQHYIETVL